MPDQTAAQDAPSPPPELPKTVYKDTKGVTAVTIGGVQHPVTDGYVTVTDPSVHTHGLMTRFFGFVEATAEEVEAFFGMKTAAVDKATIAAQLEAAGIKVDKRSSLAFLKERLAQAIEDGDINADGTPAVKTPAPAAGATVDLAATQAATPAVIGGGSKA